MQPKHLISVLLFASCAADPDGTLGGEGEIAPDIEFDSVAPADRGEEEKAPLLARVTLDGDITVEIVAPSDDSIGIGIGGPAGATARTDAVMAAIATAASPRDLYSALTGGEDAPDALVRHSEAVMAAGNWSARAMKPNVVAPVESGSGLQVDSYSAALGAPCTYLGAWGETLPGNYGNCTLYHRDFDDVTHWTLDDIIAFGLHVIAVDGDAYWEVRHRNCNTGCNWSLDYVKSIPQGFHYFFVTWDDNDDFRGDSIVWSKDNGGEHYHDAASVHDYFHRVINTSHGDQAHGLVYNSGSSFAYFCTETHYQGPDPSNIATGAGWDGFNHLDCN